ncbi:glycosyltransferase family 61 protein [Luteimonas sp. 22616]|uniref:glycosyltransferase family 61 protein n=1 Tax=Luteimonas sp. 22616 TaxID=3453951 RepID=UPI003F834CD5
MKWKSRGNNFAGTGARADPNRDTAMTDRVLSSWQSPALRLPIPMVLGEPLHPVIARSQQEAWGRASWPERDLRIVAIDDALVTHNGLVFRGDGSVVEATAKKFSREAIAGAAERHASDRDAAPFLDMEGVLCMRPGGTCYGHVLAEIMPSAWLVRKLLPGRQAALLIWSPPALVGLYGAIAAAISAENMPLVNCTRPVRVRRLLVIDGFAETDVYLSPRVREFADEIIGMLGVRELVATRRLFLPRREQQGRCVRNMVEVSACLHRHGFETVYPDELPWPEQVALFRQASHVVGIQGSALTTTMFSRPGTSVLSLAPTRMFDTFFWRIAGCCGLSYQELRCVAHEGMRSRDTGRLLDQDIEVDVALLEAWLCGLDDESGMRVAG